MSKNLADAATATACNFCGNRRCSTMHVKLLTVQVDSNQLQHDMQDLSALEAWRTCSALVTSCTIDWFSGSPW